MTMRKMKSGSLLGAALCLLAALVVALGALNGVALMHADHAHPTGFGACWIYALVLLGVASASVGLASLRSLKQERSTDNQQADRSPEELTAVICGLESLAQGKLEIVATQTDSGPLARSYARALAALQNCHEGLNALGSAIATGDLDARASADRLPGVYGESARALNAAFDLLTNAVRRVTERFEAIARGEIPAKDEERAPGEMRRLQTSMNECIDGLAGLNLIGDALKQMSVNDYSTPIRGDYNGLFARTAKSANLVQERLKSIVEAIDIIGRGEFQKLLEDVKRHGKRSEQDMVQPALLRTMESIKALVEDARRLNEAAAEGRLGTHVDAARHAGDYRRVVEGMNQILSGVSEPIRVTATNAVALASSSNELTAVSQKLASNAEGTAAQANIVSAASEQISRNVASVAAASEQMQASIREISQHANETARVAKGAVDSANRTDQNIRKLGDSSQEIGDVIKIIGAIAQQTNLLALNATIEAARAGEAGKGFAVVANEVKELAIQTAKAAEGIGQQILAIQAESNDAVSAIEEIGAVISQISDLANSIASAVEEQTVTTNEIGRSVGEAAAGVKEIVTNIGGVAAAALSTSEGANETQAAALKLSALSERLQTAVIRFSF